MYTLTITLAAFLLFLVQPLVSRIILPWFGGGASIWVTSLVFFQTMLLVGYGTSHLLVRTFGLRRHLLFMAILLLVSLAFMPLRVQMGLADTLPPSAALLSILLMSVGVPYLLLASTSPTLQYWIANDSRTRHRNPYVEYGFSNLGSLLGLLCYPFVLEPLLTLGEQRVLWTAAFIGYGLMLAVTMGTFLHHNRSRVRMTAPMNFARDVHLRWLGLAMVPSALLVVTTHHLTLDVVNLPLLWVAPLAVYLVTFILCFLAPNLTLPGRWRAVAGVLAILGLVLTDDAWLETGFGWRVAISLAGLFIIGMIFHGDLERSKPEKTDLTAFYLQVSAGGALGSILVAIVAPRFFDSTFEYDLVLLVALFYVVRALPMRPLVRHGLTAGIVAAAIVGWLTKETTLSGDALFRTRTFYSTYTVRQFDEPAPGRRLVAGTHVHGEQILEGDFTHTPLAYYHPGSGIGHVYETLAPGRSALIGLGIGSIVEYGDAGDHFDLYELDPAVVDIAMNYFTVLPASQASLDVIVGDGRLRLRHAPDNHYDAIVLDAFSSGSIPTHLITVEAAGEMLAKLKGNGVLAWHVSNQYLDLVPVLSGIALALDLEILVHESTGNDRLRMYPATWVVMSRAAGTLHKLSAATQGWRSPQGEAIVWRDEDANILSVLR